MQGRYGAKLVEKDAYLLRLSRYVHLNPVFTTVVQSKPVAERIAVLRQYVWSSYRSYIGTVRSPEYLECGPVLATVEAAPLRRRGAYRRFVEAGIESPDTELQQVGRGSPLCVGSQEFGEKVHAMYDRLCQGKTCQEDIAFRRVPRRLEVEIVLQRVCAGLLVDRDSLMHRRRDCGPRAVAARLLCDHADLTQRQVAKILRVGSGSAVSKQLRELERRLASDRDLRKTVAAISKDLGNLDAKASFNA
jgi:hypothetical protein